VTWRSLATATGSGGRLTATLAGLVNGVAYHVLVRTLNTAGAGWPSTSLALKPVAPAGRIVVTPGLTDAPAAPLAPVLVTPNPVSPTVPLPE
jgi:hypothetical protein